jgi:hypothetical protein
MPEVRELENDKKEAGPVAFPHPDLQRFAAQG